VTDTLTQYRTRPGALVVAIVDALRAKPLHCADLTRAIFGEMDPASTEFGQRYTLVFGWLERMERDGGVIRKKGKPFVFWELTV
jgi:hypothetical protein